MTTPYLPVLSPLMVEEQVRAALLEDLGRAGDITSQATIAPEMIAEAELNAREDGIVAGLDLARAAFRLMDPAIRFDAFVKDHRGHEATDPFIDGLDKAKGALQEASMWLMQNGMQNPDNAGAASTDYLQIFGLTALAYMWAQMAVVAQEQVEAGSTDPFYATKLQTGRYFVERILPDARAHLKKMQSGADVLMAMPAEAF